jgi:hypothetical protein
MVRADLTAAQGGRCKLCKLPLGAGADRPVLDHDHHTGFIRGVLHSGCNTMLGKIENNYKRTGVKLGPFLAGALLYMQTHETPQHALLHPSHKTDDEKRIRRNTLARKRRTKKEA